MSKTPCAEGDWETETGGASASTDVTVFRCENCSRPGMAPRLAAARRPLQPRVEWPIAMHEVVVPCTGRLQPEHLLKAFEAGARAVCVIACAGDNCHYLEGSRRAERRVQYVRELLDEVGLSSERLMLFHLPGSAREDMTLGCAPSEGSAGTQLNQEELGSRLAATCEKVMAKLDALEPNPLAQGEGTV
jgi:coenzyme F420-reducing hydrogenase delta subunit